MGEGIPGYTLWADLETTGLNPGPGSGRDLIIEVAVILTRTSPAFEEVGRFEAVISHGEAVRPLMRPFVLAMHEANGLLAAIESGAGMPLAGAQAAILALIDGVTADQVVLAGSGVSDFDHPFVDIAMPLLSSRLLYQDLDMAPVRRFFALSGFGVGLDGQPVGGGGHAHRAMAHAEEALSVARLFGGFLHVIASASSGG